MYQLNRSHAHDPADVLGLMMACHERIDRYLRGFGLLARVEDPADPRAHAAAAACLRYFREGLPLHGQDEDDSLAPRLRALGADPTLEGVLARMEAEHAQMEQGLPEVWALLEAFAEGRPPDAALLRARHLWLDELLRHHLALEEELVFPKIGELDVAERRLIVREIRARRQGP